MRVDALRPAYRPWLSLALLPLVLGLGAQTLSRKASVRVVNKSSWEIDHIYLTPANTHNWGKDQLGDASGAYLNKGEYFTINNLECNYYDLMVVDSQNRECILEDVDLCEEDLAWDVTDELLASCAKAQQRN